MGCARVFISQLHLPKVDLNTEKTERLVQFLVFNSIQKCDQPIAVNRVLLFNNFWTINAGFPSFPGFGSIFKRKSLSKFDIVFPSQISVFWKN